jgi:AAA15 family ATPase/GTPase
MLDSLLIRNFRLFRELKIEHLSRVNLFVGKNNSGKSCLLEAIQVYNDPSVINELISERNEDWEELLRSEENIKSRRYLFYGYRFPKLGDDPITIGSLYNEYDIIKSDGFGLFGKYYPKDNIQFVPTRGVNNSLVSKWWNTAQIKNRTKNAVMCLQLIEPEIQEILMIENIPFIRCEGSDDIIPIKHKGEGMMRLFHIILAMVNAKDGFLLIDEFENGLHWRVQPQLWDMIFKLSEKLNVQVFATTHSKDCAKSFQQIWLNDKNEKLGTFHRLESDSETGVAAVSYTCEMLSDALETDVEFR